MTSHPLELIGVTKRFGQFTAVQDMSFHLGQGEIIGFLGPNGAGKSTSLRLALGILAPDEGASRLFGKPPSLATLRRVGFLPEERGIYKRMSTQDVIAYFAELKGMDRKTALTRADELLASFGLSDFRKTRISKLSKGMAQKVQILSTLAHKPDILILDEPFSGLDPVNQGDLEALIRAEHDRGASILFSTHVMEHAERLCERLVLVASGRKMFDGTLAEAYATQPAQVKLATSPDQDLAQILLETPFEIAGSEAEPDRIWWDILLPSGANGQDALKLVISKGVAIEGFEHGEQRLRDVFVSMVSEAEAAYGEARHG